MIAIAIVIIILLLYLVQTRRANDDYLYGFWVAEGDEFCEESGVDSMLVFIGPAESGWFKTKRTCYIVIMNDLCNQGFTLEYTQGLLPNFGSSVNFGPSFSAAVVFDEENIWEDNVSISIDAQRGTMKIYSGDTIYAKLTKQHDTTNMVRDTEDAELVE